MSEVRAREGRPKPLKKSFTWRGRDVGFAGKSGRAKIPVDVAKAAAPRHNTVAKSFIMSTTLGSETKN